MQYEQLSKYISVPYLPILGTIKDGSFSKELFCGLHGNISSQPYSKNRIWPDDKSAIILWERSFIDDDKKAAIIIYSMPQNKTVAYIYTNTCLSESYIKKHQADEIFIISPFKQRIVTERTNTVFNLTISDNFNIDGKKIVKLEYHSADIQKLLSDFSYRADFPTFRYLQNAKTEGGPLYAVIHNSSIIAAIGPLVILPDHLGEKRLFVLGFAVDKSHRQKGYGTLLWNRMLKYAYEKGAKYWAFQSVTDSPADRFYRKSGAKVCGYIHKI